MIATEGSAANGVVLVGSTFFPTPRPFQGRMGSAFTQMLQRRGLNRGEFGLVEVTIMDGVEEAIRAFKPKVVVAMGPEVFRHLTGIVEPLEKNRGYVEWSPTLRAWVIGTYSPAFLVMGNANLTGVFLHDVEKALDVAEHGWLTHRQVILEDPPGWVAEAWVRAYEQALLEDPSGVWLAYDIETPYKAAIDDEGDLDVDDPSYVILRIGFSWKEGEGLSIPWQSHYLPLVKRLLGGNGVKLAHNGRYDAPRVEANGVTIGGAQWDTMWAWHMVNSDLPMGLGFIAPMLAKGQGRWKHLSGERPAFYNGVDAEVTIRIMRRLQHDLQSLHLWDLFQRHMVQLDARLAKMTAHGIQTDHQARVAASGQLQVELHRYRQQMQDVVPLAARRLKSYKKKPKGMDWSPGTPPPEGYVVRMEEAIVHYCDRCGISWPKTPHFKIFKRKDNPCGGAEIRAGMEMVEKLHRVEAFTPSNQQMQTYAQTAGHRVPLAKKKGQVGSVSFDDNTLKKLIKAYPRDLLYPLVREFREVDKLLSTYIGSWDDVRLVWVGGPPTDREGKVHSIFGHAPSTLRLSSRAPNLNNIPRVDDTQEDSRANLIKRIYIPDQGEALAELDFKAIEAQLVGYEAGDRDYVRMAKLGIHDFINSHLLVRDGLIDRPAEVGWSDDELRLCFKDLKKRFPAQRHVSKIICHSSNYATTPRHLHDLHSEHFPTVKDASMLQGLYFELFPSIRRWQNRIIKQADDTGYVRNPAGYIHRFWQVLSWRKERDGGWVSEWAEDAKRALAFGPQSMGAVLLKEAILEVDGATLYGDCLRVPIHDSLLIGAPVAQLDEVIETVKGIMERPSPYLPLPWGDGTECLSIEVEVKRGAEGVSWGNLV